MTAANDEREGNGQLKRSDGDGCPFYSLGTTDVHELVRQMTLQNQLISDLVGLVAGKNQVPMKVYVWSMVIVSACITGAKFLGEVITHVEKVWAL